MPDKFVPESVRVRLVVGQRVRYVPDHECDRTPRPSSYGASYGCRGHESTFDAENKVGIITYDRDISFPNHPYVVTMDERYTFGDRPYTQIIVAAHELALVED